ncbi:High mobility group [Dipsacomyces acuminosporus]|nr:High mobility group [Dipsacomyces acuminosporus]
MSQAEHDIVQLTQEGAQELSETYYRLAEIYARLSGSPLKTRGKGKMLSARPRDPNLPKKPMTAYLLFSNDHREEVRNAFPDLTSQEIAKKLGDAWKSTTQEERDKYTQKHSELRRVYDLDLEKYKSGKAKGSSDESKSDGEQAPAATKVQAAPAKKATKKKSSAADASTAAPSAGTGQDQVKKKSRKAKVSSDAAGETPSKKKVKKSK